MRFKVKKLKNGLRVITVPMKDNPSVTVLVMVEAGSKYENKSNNGISHFLEHMVFKGTTRRPKAIDISRELDAIGAHYNAFTGQEFTGYYAKASDRHLNKVLDIISDMYLDPIFDEKEIEKEKGVIIEEIRMYQDLPQRHVHDIFAEVLHGDQPAGWNIAGTEERVRSFGRNDLIDYRKDHYLASSTIVIVAGSFDEKKIIPKIQKAFEKIAVNEKKGKLPVKESQTEPQMKIANKETDQSHIVIGFRTFPVNDKRMPTMEVLSTIIGRGMSSRLFSKMRAELGICYYIKTNHNTFTDHGDLTISAGIDNSRLEEGIRGILDECKKLKTDKVPKEELQKAKDLISGSIMLELETSESRAEFCGGQEILKKEIESPKEFLRKINAVTANDIMRLAKEIFVNEKLNMAMVGKAENEGEIKKNLNL